MRVVIHQPYFLPWLGYLSKLWFSDCFVVLDDVNFRKRHYIDRTQIVNMHGDVQWIGVPVGEKFGVKCQDIQFSGNGLVEKLVRTFTYSYAKADCYKSEMEALATILRTAFAQNSTLVGIDVATIRHLMRHIYSRDLAISYSSQLKTPSEATERVLSICRQVGATEILIGSGKSLEVHDWQLIRDAGIRIFQQNYMNMHPIYKQVRRQQLTFEPGLSSVDALLNVGRAVVREFISDPQFSPVEVLAFGEETKEMRRE
jgi:hypothetical protein